MQHSYRKSRTGLAALLIGSALGSGLIAHTAAAQDAAPVVLDEITLYGDRTTTNIDDSTASVAVVDAEQLEQPTIQGYEDAYRRMANVSGGDSTESGFILRGVNAEGLTPGGVGTPLASFYIDGVQQTVEGTRRGLRGAFDLEQIEVYRGPQSTLTGRAALAGAIYLRTKDPEFARSGKAQLTYGSDNHKQIGLAFGDALGDRLAYRISGEYSVKDSDLKYPSYKRFKRYDDIIEDKYWNLRAKLLWLPTESDATRVTFSYARTYNNPASNTIAGPNWASPLAPSYDDMRGDIYGDIWPVNDGFVPPQFAPFLPHLAAFQDVRNTTTDNFGVEATHEINSNLTLTAVTGWTRSVTDRHSVNSGTPGELLYVDGEFDQKLFSQEVRLNYDDGGPLRWVAGAYAARETQNAFRNQVDQLSPPLAGVSLFGEATKNHATITNTALFGEVSYAFAPAWTVIAGGRVDHVKQEQKASLATYQGTTNNSSDFSDTAFIPKIGVKFDYATDASLSLIYQEGYRPGGSGIKSSDGSIYEYDPESAKNLELSWRARYLDDRLNVAANVFYQKWDDQQVEIWSDPTLSRTSYIANAGKSKSYGAELELTYEATDNLALTASAGLLHTEFEEFAVGDRDYSGFAFAGAPERSLAVGFAWGADQGWFANGNMRVQSSMLSRLDTKKPVELGGFGTVDLAVGYGFGDARVTAYATNLFDREYFTYETGPGKMATLGDRREVGLRLDYQF